MIAKKNENVHNGYFSGDEENQDEIEEIQCLAAGWYFEWEINDEYLLVIKSTSQEDDILQGETDQVTKLLEKYMHEDSLAFEQYVKENTN